MIDRPGTAKLLRRCVYLVSWYVKRRYTQSKLHTSIRPHTHIYINLCKSRERAKVKRKERTGGGGEQGRREKQMRAISPKPHHDAEGTELSHVHKITTG